jgi:hypothetical protein
MGGMIGEADAPHVELMIADDPSCRHCLTGIACGAARTLWTCPRLDDMSRNQAGRNVWAGVAQALWGVGVTDVPCGNGTVLGGSCGTTDAGRVTPPPRGRLRTSRSSARAPMGAAAASRLLGGTERRGDVAEFVPDGRGRGGNRW